VEADGPLGGVGLEVRYGLSQTHLEVFR